MILTKNTVVGEGIAAELSVLGYDAHHSRSYSEGWDIYVTDIDTCEVHKNENTVTFSRFDGKAHLKRPFLTDDLAELILKLKSKCQADTSPLTNGCNNPAPQCEFDTSSLSDTEARLLEVLLENRGSPVSAEELSRRVWGRDNVRSNIVNVYIRYLRQKLEKDSSNRIIFTVRGQGYKIN